MSEETFGVDQLEAAVIGAFKMVVDAEGYIYAGGMQDCKDDIITAHSALLSLKSRLEADRKARRAKAAIV